MLGEVSTKRCASFSAELSLLMAGDDTVVSVTAR